MANLRLQSYAIEMVMQARDETKAAFESVQKRTRGFMDSDIMSGAGMWLGVRGISRALDVITVTARAARGEWEDMIKAFYGLPLANQADDAVRAIAGIETRANLAAKATEKLRDELAALGGSVALGDLSRGLGFKTALLEADAAGKALLEIDKTVAEASAKIQTTVLPPGREGEREDAMRALTGWREKAVFQVHWDAETAKAKATVERQKEAKEKADEQAKLDRRAAEDKASMLSQLATREYNATAEDFGRQLRALDDFYSREREQWKGHADVMAALQDAYAAERAAAFMAEQERLADEWDEAWAKEGGAARSELPGRASAPLLAARLLTGGAAASPAVLTNKHLAKLVEIAERAERRDSLTVTVEN
jgi:hypothetical protein